MSRHLAKLFDSLCKLKFRLDADEKPLKLGLGMFSKEDEYVDFDQECDLSGQVSAGGTSRADRSPPPPPPATQLGLSLAPASTPTASAENFQRGLTRTLWDAS